MNDFRAIVVLAMLMAAPHSLDAGSKLHEARVLRSEPIRDTREDFRCVGTRPDRRDLSGMLAWDLCRNEFGDVRTSSRIVGWRVHYEFDGRTFSAVLDEPPGSVLPIRVRLD